MNISIELLLAIELAIGIPLLGAIAGYLSKILSSIKVFEETLKKVDQSLEDNRDEHTQLIGLLQALEKSLMQRFDLLEERIRKEE